MRQGRVVLGGGGSVVLPTQKQGSGAIVAYSTAAGGGPSTAPVGCFRPSKVPDSLARRWFTDAEIDRGLAGLAAEQREDGG